MAGIERSIRLRAWSLATFHTATFVAAVVAGVHLSGSLADRLSRLDTPTGVLIFLALWALTWYATATGLRRMDPQIDEAGSELIVMSMTVAGGWNGVGIFAVLFVVGPGFTLVTHAVSVAVIPVLFLIAVIGALLAFTIGAIVGMAYGLVDALLVGCGAALDRWSSTGDGGST